MIFGYYIMLRLMKLLNITILLSLLFSCAGEPIKKTESYTFNSRMINDLSETQVSIIGETLFLEESSNEYRVSLEPFNKDNDGYVIIKKGDSPSKVEKMITREGYEIQEIMITQKINDKSFNKVMKIEEEREKLFVRKVGSERDEIKRGMIQSKLSLYRDMMEYCQESEFIITLMLRNEVGLRNICLSKK